MPQPNEMLEKSGRDGPRRAHPDLIFPVSALPRFWGRSLETRYLVQPRVHLGGVFWVGVGLLHPRCGSIDLEKAISGGTCLSCSVLVDNL